MVRGRLAHVSFDKRRCRDRVRIRIGRVRVHRRLSYLRRIRTLVRSEILAVVRIGGGERRSRRPAGGRRYVAGAGRQSRGRRILRMLGRVRVRRRRTAARMRLRVRHGRENVPAVHGRRFDAVRRRNQLDRRRLIDVGRDNRRRRRRRTVDRTTTVLRRRDKLLLNGRIVVDDVDD